MSEQKESLIRSQAVVMLFRNKGYINKEKRILKRFLNCIKGK